jgi:hypothetical protein
MTDHVPPSALAPPSLRDHVSTGLSSGSGVFKQWQEELLDSFVSREHRQAAHVRRHPLPAHRRSSARASRPAFGPPTRKVLVVQVCLRRLQALLARSAVIRHHPRSTGRSWVDEDPEAPQIGIGPKVGFVHKEDLGADPFGLLPQCDVEGHEGLPLGWALPGRPPSVEREPLDRGRGGPPLRSKPIALGPASPKVASHWPIVWGSRSSASPTRASDHPRLNSHKACHRSRSRAVGARYIRSRSPRSSNSHRVRSVPMSSIVDSRLWPISPSAYHTASAGFIVALL